MKQLMKERRECLHSKRLVMLGSSVSDSISFYPRAQIFKKSRGRKVDYYARLLIFSDFYCPVISRLHVAEQVKSN